MNIFISYSHQGLQEKAETIKERLTNRGHNIFLDRSSINPGDNWEVIIENNLKRSTIFIVLYNLDETTSNNAAKYLNTEIKNIKAELEANSKKKVILVLFPPANENTIPKYFENINYITYIDSDTRNHKWTTEVKQAINRFEAREKLLSWVKKIKNINPRVASIFLLSLLLIFFFFTLNTGFFTNLLNGSKPKKCEDAASAGDFTMPSSYIYINKEGLNETKFLSISQDGSWQNVECKQNGKTYDLTGIEKTSHLVFFAEEGDTFSYFGTSTNTTESIMKFNSAGDPISRRYKMIAGYDIKATCEAAICAEDNKIKNRLEEEYKKLMTVKLNDGIGKSCYPIISYGKADDIYVISICGNFTRVMRGTVVK